MSEPFKTFSKNFRFSCHRGGFLAYIIVVGDEIGTRFLSFLYEYNVFGLMPTPVCVGIFFCHTRFQLYISAFSHSLRSPCHMMRSEERPCTSDPSLGSFHMSPSQSEPCRIQHMSILPSSCRQSIWQLRTSCWIQAHRLLPPHSRRQNTALSEVRLPRSSSLFSSRHSPP